MIEILDKVSVIVPVYNASKYIEDCVNSIRESTYKNLEIILIDDGSEDESGCLCDKLAKEDSRIIVLHQENKKRAFTRNRGLSIATGDWILFVDADDRITHDFIKNLLIEAKINNADIAVGEVKVEPEGAINYVQQWSYFVDKKILTTPEDKIGCIYSCAVWNKLYKKKLLDDNKILFNENLFIEDVSFTHLSTILANKIVLCKGSHYIYNCTNENSCMRSAHKDNRIFTVFNMTEYSRTFLHGKCDERYNEILNRFEIYNIWGWFKSIDPSIKSAFFNEMKKKFHEIKIDENSYFRKTERDIFNAVVSSSSYFDIMKRTVKIRIFKILKIEYVDNKLSAVCFCKIPIIEKKGNQIFLCKVPIVKIVESCDYDL